jgi:hypothetical protein
MGRPVRHSVGVRDGGGSLLCGEIWFPVFPLRLCVRFYSFIPGLGFSSQIDNKFLSLRQKPSFPERGFDSNRYRRGRVYTKHKVVMYDIGHKTVFSGGPICVLYRRDPLFPLFPLFNCQLVNRAECFAHLAKNKMVNSRRMIG